MIGRICSMNADYEKCIHNYSANNCSEGNFGEMDVE